MVEDFAALFRGYGHAFGRYTLSPDVAGSGKRQGRATTLSRGPTLDDYAAHVAGETGMGVIPLRTDNRVHFAALDIDVYVRREQEKRSITHEDVALALFDAPMIVTRSKSGGIHVWLFSSSGVEAALACQYLAVWAARLGTAGCELFPKQVERHSPGDVGNWINLPYFGDTRRAVIPRKKKTLVSYAEADLELFVRLAQRAADTVTDDWLRARAAVPASQRDGTHDIDDQDLSLRDGPPCLQALVAGRDDLVAGIEGKFSRGEITPDQRERQLAFTRPQLAEGARDNCFLNVGHYLRRRLSEHDTRAPLTHDQRVKLRRSMEKLHTEWRIKSGQKGIEDSLDRLAAQASKGRWGYACTKEPLKSHCNRRLCRQRRFGIGSAPDDEDLILSQLTIVDTADRQYYLSVGQRRVYIPDVRTLVNQGRFGEAVTNGTDRVWMTMPDAKFRRMIDRLLKEASIIEGPPEADRVARLHGALSDFVRARSQPRGKNDAAYFSGRVLISADGTEAVFKLSEFLDYVRDRGIAPPTLVAKMLRDDLHVQARGNTDIAHRQTRPYVVAMRLLDTSRRPGTVKRTSTDHV